MSSFGEELRRERELRRITLREVADATKINLRYLEALDKNDFKHLPGGVFNRGFVRAYAQFIGVDPEQMVTAYLMEEQTQAQGPGAESGERLLRGNASGDPRQKESGAAKPPKMWFKMVVAVALVAALIAVGVFLYLKFVGESTAGKAAPTTSAETAAGIVPRLGDRTPASKDDAGDTNVTDDDAKASATVSKLETPPPDAVAAQTPDPPPASRSPAIGSPLRATVYVDRTTTGRLNCDNRQLDLLNGMPPGTRFELDCSDFLIVDADDGGALRIGWPGIAPEAPGTAGVPLSGHRIDVRALSARSSAEGGP